MDPIKVINNFQITDPNQFFSNRYSGSSWNNPILKKIYPQRFPLKLLSTCLSTKKHAYQQKRWPRNFSKTATETSIQKTSIQKTDLFKIFFDWFLLKKWHRKIFKLILTYFLTYFKLSTTLFSTTHFLNLKNNSF